MRQINEISSLSYQETIELRTTLHLLENKEFLCSVCKTPDNRSDANEMIKLKQASRACTDIRPQPFDQVRDGSLKIKFSTCKGNFFSESALHWIIAHDLFEKGIMPFPGSYVEQPAKVIDVMSIIASSKASRLISQSEKQRMAGALNRGR